MPLKISGISGNWSYPFNTSCHIKPNDTETTLKLNQLLKILKTIVPSHGEFHPRYKSPCWHLTEDAKRLVNSVQQPEVIKDSRLMCMPQVYFIGFPKSGTTQLFRMMAKHPNIMGGRRKEIHMWSRHLYPISYSKSISKIVKYLKFYQSPSQYIEKSHNDILILDASQSTSWDTHYIKNSCFLPQVFANMFPKAKFIVLMREPVERLYSEFKFFYARKWKHSTLRIAPDEVVANFSKMFHHEALCQISRLEQCSMKDLDACINALMKRGNITRDLNCQEKVKFEKYMMDFVGRTASVNESVPKYHVRLGVSLYHVHIRRWLREIPREQFLFLRTDELASNPLQLMREVWHFLGVREQSNEELKKVLFQHVRKSNVGSNVTIEERTKEVLRRFYQPHNDALAELLKDDRFKW